MQRPAGDIRVDLHQQRVPLRQAAAADDESDDEKKKKKVKEDRFFALRGGIVHTVSRGELRDVTILVKNGKVVEIDRGVKIPEGAELLDARDFHIYPGLIAASSGGIFGSGAPEESTNVYSLSMTLALAGGITTALAGNTVVKLTYGSVDDMVTHTCGRVLDLFDIDVGAVERWRDDDASRPVLRPIAGGDSRR